MRRPLRAAAEAAYRVALAFRVGGMAVFPFVMTPAIFRAYGRDAAGAVVGTMMPVYSRYCVALVSAALAARAPARREFSRLHGISMGLNLLPFAGGIVLVAGQDRLGKPAEG